MHKFLSSLLISALLLTACGSEAPTDTNLIERGTPVPAKSVEIYDLSKEEAHLSFTRSGMVHSKSENSVSAQITGRITDLKVEIGDSVEQGQVIATLGDSLNTDILETQFETAQRSLDLSLYSQYYSDLLNQYSIQGANIQYETAVENYYNALRAQNNYQGQVAVQYDTSQLSKQQAEKAYYDAAEAYQTAAENTETTADQLAQLESALYQAEIAAEQADLAYEQGEAGYYTQTNQFSYNIEIAYLQAIAALNQLETSQASAELQKLQTQAQIIQSEGNTKIAGLNLQNNQIVAPISGKVTAISVKEGHLVSPGQPLIQIENTKALTVKTAISPDESKHIQVGDKVTINSSDFRAKGYVKTKSPALNATTKKIDIEINITEGSTIIPGSFAKVTFQPTTDTLYIPLNTVFTNKGRKYVRVFSDKGTVEFQYLEVGEVVGEYIEILDGLDGDEQIITTVNTFLNENEKVILHR